MAWAADGAVWAHRRGLSQNIYHSPPVAFREVESSLCLCTWFQAWLTAWSTAWLIAWLIAQSSTRSYNCDVLRQKLSILHVSFVICISFLICSWSGIIKPSQARIPFVKNEVFAFWQLSCTLKVPCTRCCNRRRLTRIRCSYKMPHASHYCSVCHVCVTKHGHTNTWMPCIWYTLCTGMCLPCLWNICVQCGYICASQVLHVPSACHASVVNVCHACVSWLCHACVSRMCHAYVMCLPCVCRSRYYKAILLKIPFATSAYALAWMPFNSTKGKSAIMAWVTYFSYHLPSAFSRVDTGFCLSPVSMLTPVSAFCLLWSVHFALATSLYVVAWMPFNVTTGFQGLIHADFWVQSMQGLRFWHVFYLGFHPCREINKGGLPMLYEIILEIAGPEIKCALEVISLFCLS